METPKQILIEFLPSDFIDASYGNIFDCPLCKAIQRQLNITEVACGFGELDITHEDGVNRDYSYDTSTWNETVYLSLKNNYQPHSVLLSLVNN